MHFVTTLFAKRVVGKLMFYYYTTGAIFCKFSKDLYTLLNKTKLLAARRDSMKYRIANSETGDYVVYRKFAYKRNIYHGTKGFLSVFLLSVGVFLTIPTPEDIVILGGLGKYVASIFNLSTGKGILYTTLIYKGAGVALICIAVILGGSYVQEKLKSQVRGQINNIKNFKRLHL